jgi:DNA-binding NarL/FixJ family response regulator
MKILIVDDHVLIREGLRQVLKDLNQHIHLIEAADSAMAFRLADEHADIDLVLLDLRLPGMSGFEALVELRKRHPGLPVVVISAHEEREHVVEAIDRGAMGFIPKSCSSTMLLSALRLVLSGGVYLPAGALARAPAAARVAGPAQPAPPQPSSSAALGLTPRQADVLTLLIQGKPNKIISRELGLAEGTVKIHVTAILKALNVVNRTQAVIEVGRLGLKLPQFGGGTPASV